MDVVFIIKVVTNKSYAQGDRYGYRGYLRSSRRDIPEAHYNTETSIQKGFSKEKKEANTGFIEVGPLLVEPSSSDLVSVTSHCPCSKSSPSI